MYKNFSELLKIAEEKESPLWKVILESETQLSNTTQENIMSNMLKHFNVMEESAKKALENSPQTAFNLIYGVSKTQNKYTEKNETLAGHLINKVMSLALSSSEVNATMGKICAAPTAGACGILPAVLIGLKEEFDFSIDKTLKGLLTASGIGALIMQNATVSGAEGGCQAECGVAACMAACAAVEMKGGTPAMALNACGIALTNVMGLVCDPIAGLVQEPCAKRNASQAVNAIISADLALGGMKTVVTLDETVNAMYQVGKQMPIAVRETAMGGIAATPTAKSISKKLKNEKFVIQN